MSAWLNELCSYDDPRVDEEVKLERRGWAVVWARPNGRSHGNLVYGDVLTDLGFTKEGSDWKSARGTGALVLAHLGTSEVEDLVVVSANWLTPKAITSIAALTTGAGARTWFVYDVGVSDDRADTESALHMARVTPDRFLEIRAGSPVVEEEDGPTAFPVVPDTGFLGFLWVSRQVLRPDEYRAVEERYLSAARETRDRLRHLDEVTEASVAHLLDGLSRGSADRNELTAVVRGAQAGAFGEGWNLRVDVDRWAERGRGSRVRSDLGEHEWRLLAHLLRPYVSSVGVLTSLGLGIEEQCRLRVDQVAPDGSRLSLADGDVAVPGSARRILAAQHTYRILVADAGGDRFLTTERGDREVRPKWVGRLLRHIAVETGIVLRAPDPRQTREGAAWTHRLGVAVTRYWT